MNLKYKSGVIYITAMKITDPIHRNLFNAIVERDLSKAQQNLSAHILDAKKYVIMGLERMIEEKKILTI